MHLFNLVEFGQRYSIDTGTTDFNNAIREASRAATKTLAQRLRFGNFDAYTDRTDYFAPGRMFGNGQNVWHRQFLMSRGFVTSGTITAYYTSSPLNFRNNDTTLLNDLTDVSQDGASDRTFWDYDAGLLFVEGVDLEEHWVIVQYSGGLDVATDDEFENVPEWLRALAMTQTALFLSNNPMFQTEDGENDITILKNDQAQGFAEHARFFPSARKPNASEA